MPDTEPRGAAVPISVLDLADIGVGQTAQDALQNLAALARHAEALGFRRFWVAEHHGLPSVASSAPSVLLAHLAAVTTTIRLGSGGVMLPNHAALVVAEQFSTLAALHPGRIDLGVGRAPGTDPATAFALRWRMGRLDDEFDARLAELQRFLSGGFPVEHAFHAIRVTPLEPVPVWVLGSSEGSAELAGSLGLPYVFAHHFAARTTGTDVALECYRASFQPVGGLSEPYAAISVEVLAADDEEDARAQALPGALSMLPSRDGPPRPLPTVDQAAAHRCSAEDQSHIRSLQTHALIGGPDQVAQGLRDLIRDLAPSELFLTSRTADPSVKRRSYTLIAEELGMSSDQAPDPRSGRP